jgi:hypothetical protein
VQEGCAIALIHDWLTGMRGGERCLEALCELYPEADLYLHTDLSPACGLLRIGSLRLAPAPGPEDVPFDMCIAEGYDTH